MNPICAPCTPPAPAPKKIGRITSLKYIVRKTNLKSVIEEHYYQKVNRPNFFWEMGNDDPKTATDRFDNDEYEALYESIINEEIDFPPESIDEIDYDNLYTSL